MIEFDLILSLSIILLLCDVMDLLRWQHQTNLLLSMINVPLKPIFVEDDDDYMEMDIDVPN